MDEVRDAARQLAQVISVGRTSDQLVLQLINAAERAADKVRKPSEKPCEK